MFFCIKLGDPLEGSFSLGFSVIANQLIRGFQHKELTRVCKKSFFTESLFWLVEGKEVCRIQLSSPERVPYLQSEPGA